MRRVHLSCNPSKLDVHASPFEPPPPSDPPLVLDSSHSTGLDALPMYTSAVTRLPKPSLPYLAENPLL